MGSYTPDEQKKAIDHIVNNPTALKIAESMAVSLETLCLYPHGFKQFIKDIKDF
jgi:hypothetical protein